jgi:hypothetical protein
MFTLSDSVIIWFVIHLVTHLHLAQRSRMSRAIRPLPNTPSWPGAQLKKHRDTCTLPCLTIHLIPVISFTSHYFSTLSLITLSSRKVFDLHSCLHGDMSERCPLSLLASMKRSYHSPLKATLSEHLNTTEKSPE